MHGWWRGEDSNLRRQSRQIYSLIPLAAREPLRYYVNEALSLKALILSTTQRPFITFTSSEFIDFLFIINNLNND